MNSTELDNGQLIVFWDKGNKSEVECDCHHASFSSLLQLQKYHILERRNNVDPVNHPAHYTSDPSGVECITITRHRNFNIGNAIKYLWRAGLKDKDTVVQDLRKAVWYIQNEIERIEGK